MPMHSVHLTRDVKGLLFGGPSAKKLREREAKDGRAAWSIKRPVRSLTDARLIALFLAAQSSQSMRLFVLIRIASN